MACRNDSTGRKRVLFVPMVGAKNPYQRQLADALGELGYDVRPVGQSANLLKSVWAWWRPAVMHLHWLHPFVQSTSVPRSTVKVAVLAVQLLLLRALGIRLVWTVHNLHDHERFNPRLDRFLNRFVARIAHRLIVHGPTAQRLVCEEYGLRNDRKIAVIPHGNYCDWYENRITCRDARARLGIEENRFVFLLLGALRPYKGTDELIRSFQELDRPDTTLVIAGKPVSEEFGREIAAAADGVNNVVVHPGFVADEDLQVYFNASDVVVFPYRDVLTSGAVVLAMSFGKCCLACQRGAIGDVLENEISFLYDPDEEDGLRTAMEQAVGARERLAGFGRRNLELARQWNWRAIAEQTGEVYV